jgi:hypothetical protein
VSVWLRCQIEDYKAEEARLRRRGWYAVVWLCSDRSSFVTGIAMPVDAGSTAGVTTR